MSSLSDYARTLVRKRAGNRCEYCLSHQDYIMGRLQIDHVIPTAKGGSNDDDNLCLACELCNQHKWTKTHGVDPDTKNQVPLYNPRLQRWTAHFMWATDNAKVVGLTPCGRATVITLKLNSHLAVTVRRNWIKAGWHPPKI